MKIDLRADLMSQDHTGYTWSLLEDAPDPSIIVPGALILAGEEGDPDDPVAVCRVVELEEINGHMVVRFEILPGDIEDYAIPREAPQRHGVAQGTETVDIPCATFGRRFTALIPSRSAEVCRATRL